MLTINPEILSNTATHICPTYVPIKDALTSADSVPAVIEDAIDRCHGKARRW